MTEITLKVTDESLMPMLRKLFNSIEGVEISRRRRKTGIEQALEDVKAGRINEWKNTDEMFNALMEKCCTQF